MLTKAAAARKHLSQLEAFKEQLICKIRHRSRRGTASDSCRRDDKA